jgi:hypothetical protein
MVDFKDALKTGLEANANAEANRAEIHDTVAALSRQVSEATDGKVGIALRATSREMVRRLSGVAAMLAFGSDKEISTVKYTALEAARLVEPNGRSELAEIEIASTGYPVTVAAPEVNEMAYDREALERAFVVLLKHPNTGGKIQRLLDTKPSTTGGNFSIGPKA